MIGVTVAVNTRPGPVLVSAIQHFAAGVVFAAAAVEILPDVMHAGSPIATIIGGAIGIAVMLLVRRIPSFATGPVALMSMVGVDILIDGLVLGIAFAAGSKAGFILTVALTIKVLFLGLTDSPIRSSGVTIALLFFAIVRLYRHESLTLARRLVERDSGASRPPGPWTKKTRPSTKVGSRCG